ncbi:hypothetical protein SMU3_07801 [Streptococcus mutans 11A1]|nr:hypothetical protein SMU3_07801 [Streptococcus mutans 11A1]
MGNLNIATTIALIAGNLHKQEPWQKFLEPVIKKVEQINRTLEVGVSAVTVSLN